MSELKTLKDLPHLNTGVEWVQKPQLRQAAIKWVKEARRLRLPAQAEPIVGDFKAFFNLKEEDLKDE